MRLDRIKRSENVDDRRGRGGGKKAAGGIGAIVMALIAIFVFKQDPVQELGKLAAEQSSGRQGAYTPTPEEEEMSKRVDQVLYLTEVVWGEIFPDTALHFTKRSSPYVEPTLVKFSGQVQSACGHASAAMGPFYCPADQQVFIDLAFFKEMEVKMNAPGDFAQAYVVAHEVGHHVQKLLGFSEYVHRQRLKVSKAEYNELSVRLELQADYFAGVWARHAQEKEKILEEGDIEEGLRAAFAVGDDTIQKRAQGYVVPEAFTHGSAEQRIRWFSLGLKTGDPTAHNPFDLPYEKL